MSQELVERKNLNRSGEHNLYAVRMRPVDGPDRFRWDYYDAVVVARSMEDVVQRILSDPVKFIPDLLEAHVENWKLVSVSESQRGVISLED